MKRVYYLYDVPSGENRGSHVHKELSQLIIAASGSFNVTLDDGKCKHSFFLNLFFIKDVEACLFRVEFNME